MKGKILDDFRIQASLPVIRFLKMNGAIIVVAAHRGRPHGKIIPGLSMRKVALKLAEKSRMKLHFVDIPPSPTLTGLVKTYYKPSTLLFLENIRFWKGEERNSRVFVKNLASLGEVYVNDAFGDCHREHASIVGIPRFLPSFAGLELRQEVKMLGRLHRNVSRPFIFIMGGGKVASKISLLAYALTMADHVLVGGALANSLLHAKGLAIGKSYVEEEALTLVQKIELTSSKLHLPLDVIVAKSPQGRMKVRPVGKIFSKERIYDVGPDTIKLFSRVIREAKTIVWNGPLGLIEIPSFCKATDEIARAVAAQRCLGIIGGGETVARVRKLGLERKVTFLSAGGGAMVEFLVKRTLPGLEALSRANAKFKVQNSK